MNKSRIIWTSIGVVAVVAGGFLWFEKDSHSLATLGGFADIEAQGGTVELDESLSVAPVPPSLSHKVDFRAKMVPEAKVIVLKNIETLQAQLRIDANDFHTWNTLAQHYQTAEDFLAARDVWEYLVRVFPTNHIAFGNLGFLYGYYLKDLVKAEQYYLKAIANAPDQAFLYFQTAEFYRDVLKDLVKARQIVEKGIVSNPNSAELKALLESLRP